jgi:hypothetical protein
MLASFEAERDRLDAMINSRPGNRPQPQAAKGQKTAQAGDR